MFLNRVKSFKTGGCPLQSHVFSESGYDELTSPVGEVGSLARSYCNMQGKRNNFSSVLAASVVASLPIPFTSIPIFYSTR